MRFLAENDALIECSEALQWRYGLKKALLDIKTTNSVEEFLSVILKEMERGMKPRKKRVMEPSTEPVMEREMRELKAYIHDQNQEMNRELKAYIHDQNQEMKQEMKRELKAYIHDQNQEMKRGLKADIHDQNQEMKLKAYNQEMKCSTVTSSTQGAPADWNLNPSCWRPSPYHRIKKSEEKVLQLGFANKLADQIFTGDKIRDVSDRPVQINLIDTISGKIEEMGPHSSTEIEFVVLDDAEDQEFKAINHRNKGPLLKGKVTITLTAGVSTIQDLSFGDNSSWRRTKKFKLGARVKQSNIMGQVRIKEAISEAFTVKDHRGKRARKHDLPSTKDEVWHLKKIKKNGKFHTRLVDSDIHTVGDLLDMYKTQPDKLREILKDCTDQVWKALEQDVTCAVLDDVSTVLLQGTVGMQKDNNYASSPHHNSTGPSPTVCPDLAMSTNAQGEQGDFCFQKLSNGDSGWNSSQELSEVNLFPTTEFSQNNNELHSNISAVQPAPFASDDGKLNADHLITHESPGLHQGIHNTYDNASLSHNDSGFIRETGQNLVSWPQMTMPTPSPNFNAQWLCNGFFQNNGYGDPGWTPTQINGSNSLFMQSPQINNGIARMLAALQNPQNTVMPPDLLNEFAAMDGNLTPNSMQNRQL
ncbi:hypothetical protein EZV62_006503 [Acer yangbiense]|uniref:Calmodulin-binding domain-containing protein n=1 Tax=Acer yangbiense TaxID=1000413 RepID=A0A5C7I840_9ROSI|nr:hypothetical protein EZV62_006503 [Acer yangbiense]